MSTPPLQGSAPEQQEPAGPPKVLFVDDEVETAAMLSRFASGHYSVATAFDATEGFATLSHEGPFAVVVSDLNMPGTDGLTFLAQVQASWADTVRVVLTGTANLAKAILAINNGHVFRFLTKPCSKEQLLAALEACAEQYRIVTAEKMLLEKTLLGTVKSLTDILSLASPAAYGRSTRVKYQAAKLIAYMSSATGYSSDGYGYGSRRPGTGRRQANPYHDALKKRWEIELAALLSQLGAVGLPADVAQRLYLGKPLTPPETRIAERIPATSSKVVANIPRLEGVRRILEYQQKGFDGSGIPADNVAGEALPLGSRILKILLDYDSLETRGMDKETALSTMKKLRAYDPVLLNFFAVCMGMPAREEVREVPLSALRPGMRFAEDVIATNDVLLAARGLEVTPAIMAKIESWQHIGLKRPIRVIVESVE
ncbi:MAG: HD domain-containing phosphohydrolase [Pseudomonadota bacterium]